MTLGEALERNPAVVPASAFHRLTEREFGMPGLVAIESVGPFVEIAKVGPFITIHDSYLDPGLGIGHHPHRGNERLFYILEGEIRHDDALNGIQGVMGEGDLARLTEGERGMLHREWNGRDDVRTHAFILVYTPDTDPPIPLADFDALRAADIPRIDEGPGAETLQLIGGDSRYHVNSSQLTTFFDTTLSADASIEHRLPPNSGVFLYPLEGAIRVSGDADPGADLRGHGDVHPEGPDAIAIAWSDAQERMLRLAATDGPARIIRLGFERRGDDLVAHRPYRRG